MASFEEIREYFSRHFLGRIKINGGGWQIAAPAVNFINRLITTHKIRGKPRVKTPVLLIKFRQGLKCCNKGFRISRELVKIHGEKIELYTPEKLAIAHVSLTRKFKIKEALNHARVLPQERMNRLRWQRDRPVTNGEVLLAWYGPLIHDAVIKLALNKQRGTLLIWYNPASRHFRASGLYLCRRLANGARPEWRWV